MARRCKLLVDPSDFKDTMGLGQLPAKVEAKVFRHREGKSLTITLLDRRSEQRPFDVTLEAEGYGRYLSLFNARKTK